MKSPKFRIVVTSRESEWLGNEVRKCRSLNVGNYILILKKQKKNNVTFRSSSFTKNISS